MRAAAVCIAIAFGGVSVMPAAAGPRHDASSVSQRDIEISAAQHKKQKKQLDLARKRQGQLKQQLAGAKKQLDDPAEVRRLERELAELEQQIARIQEG